MPEKQLVISLSALNRVEAVCLKCESSISFAASENGSFPTKCSACGETLHFYPVQRRQRNDKLLFGHCFSFAHAEM